MAKAMIRWGEPGKYPGLKPDETLWDWLEVRKPLGRTPRQLSDDIAKMTGLPQRAIYKAVRRACEKAGYKSNRDERSRTIIDGLLSRHTPRVDIRLPPHEEADPDALFQAYTQLHREMRKMRRSWSDISVTVPDAQGPVGIAFMSDWHIGPVGTDLEALERDIDLLRNTPAMYVYVGGDAAHNFILSTMAHFGSYEGDMRIDDEWILYERFLKKLEPIIIAVGDGNHSWTTRVADDNRVAAICDKLHLVYTGFGGFVRLTVGEQTYSIYRTHKARYNSSFNLTHAVKRMYEMAPQEFDVGVVEHGHDPTIEPFDRHGKTRLAVRTGTYLLDSPFVDENQMHWRKGTPVVVFDNKVRRMTGFMEIAAAAQFLRGLYPE